MGRTKVYESDSERRKAQNIRRKSTRAVVPVHSRRPLRFTGVDGEGTGRNKDHRYVLLGIGSQQIENPSGLHTLNIFQFLYDSFLLEPKNTVFEGFYLMYDFTQWLKYLPEDRARYLFTKEGIARRKRSKSGNNKVPFPVRWAGWEFDILGVKRFKLRPERPSAKWMYICDSGSFFQSSFLKAIDPEKWNDPIVTEAEYNLIKKGKESREHAVLDDDMRMYNRLENLVLARLLGNLSDGFAEMGIRLGRDQWFGPGQAAQEWLNKQKNVPTAEQLTKLTSITLASSQSSNVSQPLNSGAGVHGPLKTAYNMENSVAGKSGKSWQRSILDIGGMAYYGGWFEIFAHGHVPGDSWEYDINSAYPYIASRLPCLLHGRWTYYEGGQQVPSGDYQIIHARLHGSDRHIGAALHRHPDGRIVRPWTTQGYYWTGEVSAAVRAGVIDTVEVLEAWDYEPCDCDPPLAGLDDLYDLRLSVGKDTPRGKAAKNVYNSAYGKFAQSVGRARYGNSIYASRITSGTREMILDAIWIAGTGNTLMVATDAVFFTKQVGLTISDKLGEWSETKRPNLTLFKPGVYWDDNTRRAIADGRDAVYKSRGISAKEFSKKIREIDSQFSRWEEQYPGECDPDGPGNNGFPKVKFISGFSMVSCNQALNRGKWDLAGTVTEKELVQDSDPVTKRRAGWYDEKAGIYRSQPYEGWWETESTPYDKTFGQGELQDPEEYGLHPDGWVLDLWRGMIQ